MNPKELWLKAITEFQRSNPILSIPLHDGIPYFHQIEGAIALKVDFPQGVEVSYPYSTGIAVVSHLSEICSKLYGEPIAVFLNTGMKFTAIPPKQEGQFTTAMAKPEAKWIDPDEGKEKPKSKGWFQLGTDRFQTSLEILKVIISLKDESLSREDEVAMAVYYTDLLFNRVYNQKTDSP